MFLAAIMVLSVVGMSVAFAGAAAAEEPSEVEDFDDIEGELHYEGQEFNVTNSTDATGDINTNVTDVFGADGEVGDSVYLVRVTDRDGGITGASTVGSAISVEGDNQGDFHFDLDLSGLDPAEEYAISNQSGSSGVFSDAFDISEQQIDADWDDDRVTDDDDDAELEIDLDRNEPVENYNLTVWVDGPDDFETDDVEDLLEANEELNETLFIDDGSFEDAAGDQDFLPLQTLEDDFDIDVDADARDDGDNLEELEDVGIVTFELNESSDELDGAVDELELEADFSAIDFPDDGDYEFNFLITDTGAHDTDSIELNEQDIDGEFSAGTYDSPAGDIASFEFELEDTDETWIQIGDDDSDFLDILYVDVDDADDEVEVDVNTRLLGTNQSQVNTSDVYDVENEDDYFSAYHDADDFEDTADDIDGYLFEDDGDELTEFDEYVEAVGIADQANESLTRPLQPTDYELQLAGDDIDDDEGLFDADAGAGEAVDQLDSAVLELQDVNIGEIITHTAPADSADNEDEIEDLVEVATERTDIAVEDRLVVQVEATGIYGSLVADPTGEDAGDLLPDWERLDDDEVIHPQTLDNVTENEEGVTFEIVADEGAGNQDPNELDLGSADDDEIAILADKGAGEFFVVVDTDAEDAWTQGEPDEAESFTVEFEYDADDGDDRFEFDNDDGVAPEPYKVTSDSEGNFPYLAQGNTIGASVEFDIEERDVSFDNLNADDEVQAENIEDAEISGETNIAPGTDAELRVSSTDASTSFRVGEDVDINEDGEFSAAYDFSEQEPGDEFDTRFRASGSTVDTVDSVIVAEGDLGVEEPVEDDEDDVVDDDDDVVDDDDDVVDDDDDVEEPTDDETPGFGALVALVALIGAALLAVRRQNN